jgi:dolichol-phosphate mannosyltransferase
MQANLRSPTAEKKPRIIVVLCTYNEIENLPSAVETIRNVAPDFHVLIVDDNSPDGTGKWATALAERDSMIHVLSRPEKLGLGAALRDAFQWCLNQNYDFLINLDADLSHDPAVAPELLKLCIDSNADVTIGSRYVKGGRIEGLSRARILASRMINWFARKMLSLQVNDCSGSFRCYRVSKLRELDLNRLRCQGYGFLQEILVALVARNAVVVETPICYHVRRGGKSKLRWKDATGALRVIYRLRKDRPGG